MITLQLLFSHNPLRNHLFHCSCSNIDRETHLFILLFPSSSSPSPLSSTPVPQSDLLQPEHGAHQPAGLQETIHPLPQFPHARAHLPPSILSKYHHNMYTQQTATPPKQKSTPLKNIETPTSAAQSATSSAPVLGFGTSGILKPELSEGRTPSTNKLSEGMAPSTNKLSEGTAPSTSTSQSDPSGSVGKLWRAVSCGIFFNSSVVLVQDESWTFAWE